MIASLCWLILGCLVGTVGTLCWCAYGPEDDDDENDDENDDDLQADDESDASGSQWIAQPRVAKAKLANVPDYKGKLPKITDWAKFDKICKDAGFK